MRVAVFHNRYVFRGGEDAVVDLEVELLRKAGHEVHLFSVDSARDPLLARTRLRAGLARALEPGDGGARRRLPARSIRWTLGHVHNFFPLLSPAVHAALNAARASGGADAPQLPPAAAPTGSSCARRAPARTASRADPGTRCATAAIAARACRRRSGRGPPRTSRRRGTWHELRGPLRRAERVRAAQAASPRGFRPSASCVKPNPVADPGEPRWGGHGAVYVGRLSAGEGRAAAARGVAPSWRLPALRSSATGPEEAALRALAAGLPEVRFTGALPPERRARRSSRAPRSSWLRRSATRTSRSRWRRPWPPASPSSPRARPRSARWSTTGRTGLLFQVGDAREPGRGLSPARRRPGASPTDGARRSQRLRGSASLRSAAWSGSWRSTKRCWTARDAARCACLRPWPPA